MRLSAQLLLLLLAGEVCWRLNQPRWHLPLGGGAAADACPSEISAAPPKIGENHPASHPTATPGCASSLRGPTLRPPQQLGQCLHASVDGDVYLFSEQPAALREEAQLWNRLYSNSTPVAVVGLATVNGVAAAVKCVYAAGVKVVAK